jgi:ring-1,2-phenylacetyl-CoA epoxidase subunit PaaA
MNQAAIFSGEDSTMAEVSTQTFDIGDPLPDEYRDLLVRMMAHEGERTGNKSFMQFFESVLDCAEKYAPNQDAQLTMAGYVAEEMKHCIMFHRLIMEIDKDLVFRDTPFAHYAFHIPRNSWTDMNWFNFFLDLNGAFHAGEWKHSSYLPLRRIAPTIERDEFGHSDIGYRFLQETCKTPEGRAEAQEKLNVWYPAALDTFGTSTSKRNPRFIYWGLKNMTNEAMRQAYRKYTDEKIHSLGLTPPDEKLNRRFL